MKKKNKNDVNIKMFGENVYIFNGRIWQLTRGVGLEDGLIKSLILLSEVTFRKPSRLSEAQLPAFMRGAGLN